MGFCGTVNLHTDFLAVKSQTAYMPNLVLHDSWVDITNLNVHSVYLLLSQHHTVATQLSKQGRRQVLNVSAETHSSVWSSCFPNMAWSDGLSKCGPKMHAQRKWLKQVLAALINKQPVSLLDSEVNFSPKAVVCALVLARDIYFHLASFYQWHDKLARWSRKIFLSSTVGSVASVVLKWKASFMGQTSHHHFIC